MVDHLEPCKYCSSKRVAAVLDKRLEVSDSAGNKYRRRCLDCERWLPMCSAADFQNADHQHVLPRGADPEGAEPTVPATEFDGDVSGLATATSGGESRAVMTDGGEDVEADEPDSEPENAFDCPNCGGENTGFPVECPECGVAYNWPDEGEEGA